MRRLLIHAGVLLFSAQIFAADELPSSEGEESFDIEPALLIPYERPKQGAAAREKESKDAAPPSVDVEQLTKDVERAKRSALNAEHLYRIGALARIEAEARALKVVKLQSELESARLARAKEDVNRTETIVDQKNTAAPAVSAMAQANDAELAKAIQAAHAAKKKRDEAEIAAAEENLTRQQKLLSLGSGRKADVAKAERKLQELKAARN